MMQIIYRIFYHPLINGIFRTIVKNTISLYKKKLFFPISGIIKFKAKSGKTIYFDSNPTSFVLKKVYWGGLENYEYMDLFQKMIPTLNCYIDIGANVGLYS